MAACVIKSAEAAFIAPVLAPLELRDVRGECEAYIEAARREAEALRARAATEVRARVAEAMELARQRGFEAGHKAGVEAGHKEGLAQALAESRATFAADAAAALAALESIQSQWNEMHRRLFVDARHDVVALALAIARRIIPRLAEIEPTACVDTCAAALQMVGRGHEMTLRAHPADIEALRQFAANSRVVDPAAAITWIEDESVGRGGVRIETGHGSVDATLATQLDRMADELLNDWRNRIGAAANAK